ncbi:MAG: transporter substrate-binding domain-containing protein [Chloroflexi bacterium]|nr:transporter substrate-binding domain-containing protein [Chloroflexota bacterium]
MIAILIFAVIFVLRPTDSNSLGAALPDRIRSSGQLNIAIANVAPQALAGGSFQGFDVDVARAVAQSLGIRAQIDVIDPAALRAGIVAGRWDVGFGIQPPAEAAGIVAGHPYLWRTAVVLGKIGADLVSGSSLDGRRICVVGGSVSEQWLRGTPPGVVRSANAPNESTADAQSTIAACLADVRDGRADAFIADWGVEVGSPGEGLEIQPLVPFLSVERPWTAGSQADAARLVDAIDGTLETLQADGTLRAISERRFGGLNLTIEPPG